MEQELVELRVIEEIEINNIIEPQLLLDIVLNNRLSGIDNAIKKTTKEILNHKHEDYGNKQVLILACTNDLVTRDTLNTLCQSIRCHYYHIDCFDKDWYKWEPLHYVARRADPEKLQVLLDNSIRVNSLTTFSENALHILLEYQQSVKPFNAILYNSTRSKECIIINTERDNVFDCALKLVQAGIDVNHSNLWNETPICIAIRYRYVRIIELLLKSSSLDIDSYKEGGTTVRAYLKDNFICKHTPSQSNNLYENPVKIIFSYLKSGDEEAFMEFNNGNIKDYVNSIDGDTEFNSTGNMLQLCFKKGYLEYLQNELYGDKLIKGDVMDSPMLNVFCSKGLGRSIEHILNNGANPKLTYRKFSQTLLEAAAVVGYYPLVAILLQHKTCKFTFDDIFEILPRLFEQTYNLTNHEYYRKCVLSLFLNKLLILKSNEILSDEKLDILNNILLRLNLERDDEREDDSENICRILKLGASLVRKVKNKMLIQYIHPDILKLHFDDCIENNLLYYNSIIEDNCASYSETRVLYFLANSSERNELLRHPLFIHYIHNKWQRNFYFFYFNLFLYFLFLLSIYTYMVSTNIKYFNPIINSIFYTLLALHSVKECIQLFLYCFKYFLNTSNYLEMTVIISSGISICCWNEYSAVTAILSSTVVFVMLLGQIPVCAKFTIIFGSTKYFLQYAGFYFIQFISFALVFYITFPFIANPNTKNESKYNSTNADALKNNMTDTIGDLLKNLFYTLIFFTGEYSDEVLDSAKFPFFGRIVMATFIFCMTIILNNLLVGLIVADMGEIQRAGKLHKQVKTGNFIARMNLVVKRLYELKANTFFKHIMNFLHIFKKGENKILDLNKCKHTSVFDDENLKYLKTLRNKSNAAYNKDLLKNVYTVIIQKINENQKKKKS